MRQIWRIKLNSKSIFGNDPTTFCFDSHILGFGYPLSQIDTGEFKSEKEFREFFKKEKLANINININSYKELCNHVISVYSHNNEKKVSKTKFDVIYNQIKIDDFVWARNKKGIYYLGKVTSEYEYKQDVANYIADIHHIRQCKWVKIGELDKVPGFVIASYQQKGIFKRFELQNSSRFLECCNNLYNQDIKKMQFTIDDLYRYMTSDEVEDIISFMIQTKGYYLVPSSAKKDTQRYEFFLINNLGEIVKVQVKNSNSSFDFATNVFYNDISDNARYMFFSRSGYENEQLCKWEKIERRDADNFILNNWNLMPPRIRDNIEILR